MPIDNTNPLITAVRLHGPSDLRVDLIPSPGPPGARLALIRVKATGICGSDLHSYLDARIGDTPVEAPLILGHEFAGVVEAVGPEACDGHFQPLQPGIRVAVDPAQPCGRCEWCEQGHPNLCANLHFCGNFPYGGSLCERILMPARSCFPIPESMGFADAALLEPLGVALHAIDLARVRVGNSMVILGAGPIGLLILQLARLAGADPVFVTDKLPWRLEVAERYGAVPVAADDTAVQQVITATSKRGVDIAIEAAWADESVGQAVEMARLGGRIVLVGIPSDDRLMMKHSTARRKGVTIRLSRRMKHVYSRAIQLQQSGRVDLQGLISHRFPLERTPEAFALNTVYRDKVVKIIIES